MTDAIRQRLLDLKAAQDADTPMRCPRCGADTMKHPMATNALSRVADLYICDSCGNAEGLLAFMQHSHPLHRWSVFQPQKPDSDFKARPTKDVLAEVLQTLTPREEKVLRLRFGLEDGRSRTLEEVGKEFNVTRERIRQIEAKALRKLRHPSRSKKLKDFLD